MRVLFEYEELLESGRPALRIEEITPDMAFDLLSNHNDDNRALRPGVVSRYARDMRGWPLARGRRADLHRPERRPAEWPAQARGRHRVDDDRQDPRDEKRARRPEARTRERGEPD